MNDLDRLLAQLKDALTKEGEEAARQIRDAISPESQRGDTQYELFARPKQENRGRVISVTEFDESDGPLIELWEQIKRHLPEHMVNTPEREEKYGWHIGFLVGLYGEKVVAKILRRLWRS